MLLNLKRRFSASTTRPRRATCRLHVETLEGRALLSLTPIDFGATITTSPVAMNGALYFGADDGVHGKELWKSDGTASGTAMLKDINPGPLPSNPTDLTVVDNKLFFSASDGTHGFELWESDGTAAGTTMVKDVNPGVSGSYPQNLTNFNGTLLYEAYAPGAGYELFRSDGPPAARTWSRTLTPAPPPRTPVD